MGKIFIIVSTIILLLVVIQRNTSNNIRLFKRLKNIIFEINSVYLELFKDRSLARRIRNIDYCSRNIYYSFSSNSSVKAY